MSFAEQAIESADKYWKYLNNNNKGYQECLVLRVERKHPNTFDLVLNKRIFSLDSVQVKLRNNIFEVNEISPCRYEERAEKGQRKNKEIFLTVKVAPPYIREFLSTQPNDIKVVSDLKFLVKRVESWYKDNRDFLSFPLDCPSGYSAELPELSVPASKEQMEAVEHILSNPLSYIWGAPGTGKTKSVLARCVLAYIMTGQRVLVVAPTNVALEQTLRGILPFLEEAGIGLGCALRLGTSTKEFADEYGAICENVSVEKLVGEIKDKIEDEQQAQRDYNTVLACRSAIEECSRTRLRAFDILDSINKNLLCIEEADRRISLNRSRILFCNNSKSEKSEELKQTENEILLLTNKINKYQNSIFARFKKKALQASNDKLGTLFSKRDQLEFDCGEIEKSISVYNCESAALEDEKAKYDSDIEQLLVQLAATTEYLNKYNNISPASRSSIGEYKSAAARIFEAVDASLREELEKYTACISLSDEQLYSRLAECEKNLSDLEKELARYSDRSTDKRLTNTLLLAATVDTYIGRISREMSFTPRHIFLDEAGYCPLIKAATLLYYSCPVTLLGDHMQLQPICEMKRKEISVPTFLWAASALYIEHIFDDINELYSKSYNNISPDFELLKKFTLTKSYRFGETMAEILSRNVYEGMLFGNPLVDTDVICIDVPYSVGDRPRANPNEAFAVAQYVIAHHRDNIGILTPYKDQIACIGDAILRSFIREYGPDLGREMAKEWRTKISSVHASQGREWDTVLFSVVDTKDKFYVTVNCAESGGKFIINTAVSRAKKKLCIFCDRRFWLSKTGEFITDLISVCNTPEPRCGFYDVYRS